MNKESQCLNAIDQLNRLRNLFSRSKNEFEFICLCNEDMGIHHSEAVLFYKLLDMLSIARS